MQELLSRETLFRMIIQNWTLVTGAALASKEGSQKLICLFGTWMSCGMRMDGYRLSVEKALIPLTESFLIRIHARQPNRCL